MPEIPLFLKRGTYVYPYGGQVKQFVPTEAAIPAMPRPRKQKTAKQIAIDKRDARERREELHHSYLVGLGYTLKDVRGLTPAEVDRVILTGEFIWNRIIED